MKLSLLLVSLIIKLTVDHVDGKLPFVGNIISQTCATLNEKESAIGTDGSSEISSTSNQTESISSKITPESILTSLANEGRITDPEISSMEEKYKGRLIRCSIAQFPNCDVLLCGTLHVAKTSADMVQDTLKVLRPEYIVLELCEARIDNLCEFEEERNISLSDVIKDSYKEKSFKVLGMGLLCWMQLKAAKVVGSKLGGELVVAAKVGVHQGATVILGDRLYGVTIQRVFDKLKLYEKLKMAFVLIWEIMTMSFFKLKDYIKKSENEEGFIQDEIARFAKHLPAFAKVLIEERDEYLSQTIFEIARVVNHSGGQKRIRIVAVVGAGHLSGIQRCLAAGGVSDDRYLYMYIHLWICMYRRKT